jgi:hypothetical protein
VLLVINLTWMVVEPALKHLAIKIRVKYSFAPNIKLYIFFLRISFLSQDVHVVFRKKEIVPLLQFCPTLNGISRQH